MTQSAISRQVKLLEAQSGQTLYLRVNRGLQLTSAGQTLFAAVSQAHGLVYDAIDALAEDSHITSLVVAAATPFPGRPPCRHARRRAEPRTPHAGRVGVAGYRIPGLGGLVCRTARPGNPSRFGAGYAAGGHQPRCTEPAGGIGGALPVEGTGEHPRYTLGISPRQLRLPNDLLRSHQTQRRLGVSF